MQVPAHLTMGDTTEILSFDINLSSEMRDLMLNPDDDDKDEGISTDRSADQTSLVSSRRSSIVSQQEDGPGMIYFDS